MAKYCCIVFWQTFKASLSRLLKPGEKTYTQRCRLFVGNLPNDITEDDFRKMFVKYGEPSEVFINKVKGFGFIRLVRPSLLKLVQICYPECTNELIKLNFVSALLHSNSTFSLAGVSGTGRNSKSRPGWHPDEKQALASQICNALCSTVCEESVSICFQRALRGSLFSVWNGWEGHCYCGWPWTLQWQGCRGVCLKGSCPEGPGSVQWGCFPSHHVSQYIFFIFSLCLKEKYEIIRLAYLSFLYSNSGHPVLLLLSLLNNMIPRMGFQKNWHKRTLDIKGKSVPCHY